MRSDNAVRKGVGRELEWEPSAPSSASRAYAASPTNLL